MDQVEYEMILQCSGNGRKKAAIMGALKLYLDFINMFMLLLQQFGRRP